MYKLPKTKKILKAQEFKRTLKIGKKFVVPELVLFAAKNNENRDVNRMGFIVTKKIGNAVERNKVKRRLREIFRQIEQKELQAEEKALDLVFIARAKTKTASYQRLEQSFKFAYNNMIKRHKR